MEEEVTLSCTVPTSPPEERIARILRVEAGIHTHPQVIRLLIRQNWSELAKAAHEIHRDT